MTDISVIDPELSGEFIYFYNNGYGMYHASLIKEKLFYDLLECNEDVYLRFLDILKCEG